MVNVVATAVAALVAVFLMPIIAVFFGALSGAIVGLFFGDAVRSTIAVFGGDASGVSMWQLGAGLGFIGGFFKSTLTTNGS